MKYKRIIIITCILSSGLFALLASSNTHLYRKRNRPGLVYWHGDYKLKKVALTFDDGPNEPYTSQILEILKEKNVRATFFMIGENVNLYPKTARAVVEAGHAIGNHSFNHKNMIFETDGAVRKQILKTNDAIVKATGFSPRLFRPPYGGDDPLTFMQTKKLGYIVIKWTISSRDWEKPGVDRIVSNVLTRAKNGSIILMHDGDKIRHGGDRSQTVAALPKIIDGLRAQGYEFTLVTDLLGLDNGLACATPPANSAE